MDVYRITIGSHTDDLTGTGAKLVGGRWNRQGTPVLYTSSSRALATLEVLVHAPSFFVPKAYTVLTIYVPDDSLRTVPRERLPDGWDQRAPPELLCDISEQWLTDAEFLAMKVPSAIVDGEFNYLLNPAHARFSDVYIREKQPYRFDERL